MVSLIIGWWRRVHGLLLLHIWRRATYVGSWIWWTVYWEWRRGRVWHCSNGRRRRRETVWVGSMMSVQGLSERSIGWMRWIDERRRHVKRLAHWFVYLFYLFLLLVRVREWRSIDDFKSVRWCHEALGQWGGQLFRDVAQIALDQRAWDHFDGGRWNDQSEYLTNFQTHRPNMGILDGFRWVEIKNWWWWLIQILFPAPNPTKPNHFLNPSFFFSFSDCSRVPSIQSPKSPSHLRPAPTSDLCHQLRTFASDYLLSSYDRISHLINSTLHHHPHHDTISDLLFSFCIIRPPTSLSFKVVLSSPQHANWLRKPI